MLNAVWVAVIVAVACWVVVACAAVYLMLKAAGLMSQTTAAVAGLRERQDVLIDRANATIDRASEQLVKTDTITASMDEVTANMAELTGRVTALAPLARVIGASAGSPVAKVAALAYGVNRALWIRRPAARGGGNGAGGGGNGAGGGSRPETARVLPRGAAPGWRRPALNGGRRDEVGS